MKNELPAQTLSDVAQAWKAGTLANSGNTYKRSSTYIVGKNVGQSVSKNTPCTIIGFSLDLPFAKAYNKMLDDSLHVKFRYTNQPSEEPVFSVEPIKRNCYGRLEGDVVFGVVTFLDTTHTYATTQFGSAESGPYHIVARSGFYNNKAVCALMKVGGESKDFGLDIEKQTFLKSVLYNREKIRVALKSTTKMTLSRATNPVQCNVITALNETKGSLSLTPETGTAVTSVTPASGSVVESVSPSSTQVVASIETTPGKFITEVKTEDAQFVDDVTTQDDSFLTKITPQKEDFVKEIKTLDDQFVKSIETSDVDVITDVKTEDDQFVQKIETGDEVVCKTIKTTPTQVVGSLTPEDGDAVTSVTGKEVRVITKLSPRSGKVLKGVTPVPAKAVTDVTPLVTATFIQTLNAPTGTFAKDLATTQKTVVTGASLVVDDTAAGGGIQVVTAVECVNNQIVVQTAYIRLAVQTEVVNVVQTFTPSPAVTSVTPAKTDTAIKSLNVPKENFVKSITPEPEFAVLEIKPETEAALVNIQAPTAKFLTKVTPADKTVLESAEVDDQATVIKSVTPTSAAALTKATGTPGKAIGVVTPTPAAALTSATGTPGQAMTDVTPADAKAIIKVTPSKSAALTSATGTEGDAITAVTPTPTQVVESIEAPTTTVVTSVEAPTSSFLTSASLEGDVITAVDPTTKTILLHTFEDHEIPEINNGEYEVITKATPTTGEVVTDITVL